MKFLIAASFLCLALFGQIQGGSLRGRSVIIPHQQYGVPLLSSVGVHQTEEIKPEIDETQPAIIIESTTSKPAFIGDLPFVESTVNFGYPSGRPTPSPNRIEPVTEKPELPILQPGFPSLPAAPIVPIKIEQPAQDSVEPSNHYLPPFASIVPHIIEQSINVVQEIPNNNVHTKPVLPLLQPGLPSLPAAPIVPLSIEEPTKVEQPVEVSAELSDASPIPKPEIPIVPSVPVVPQFIGHISQGFSYINNLPSTIGFAHVQPAASIIPLSIQQPIQISQRPSNAYLPPQPEAQQVQVAIPIEQPIQSNNYLLPKPDIQLLQPGLPSLPEAPKIPLSFVTEGPIVSEAELSNSNLAPKPELPILQPGLPSLPEVPKAPLNIVTEQPFQSQAELSNSYLPPKAELPLLQPGLPSLPEAPKVPLAFVIEQPIQAKAEQSNSNLAPELPNLPLLQPGLPSLPEAPKVPLAIVIEQPAQPQAGLSNYYLVPKPVLSILQPGLPSLPEAPKIPLTIATELPAQGQSELSNAHVPQQPELPRLQPGLPALPAAPIVPLKIEQPLNFELAEVQKPSEANESPILVEIPELPLKPESNEENALLNASEIPALPEASVLPASPQANEESKVVGYTYNKPASAFIETAQAPIVDEIKQEPVGQAAGPAQQHLSQIPIAPGYISSQILDLSQANHIQPAQQVLLQPALPAQQAIFQHSQQVLIQPSHQEQQVNLQNIIPIQQQLLLQPSLPAQQILDQPSAVPVLPEVNKAPANHGYVYSPPKLQFLLPNQYSYQL